MPYILDNVSDLMKLSRGDLDDVICSENYNRANLRQMLRLTLATANDYKKLYEYEQQKNNKSKTDEPLERLLGAIEYAAGTMDTSPAVLLARLQNKMLTDDDE